jgi:hypothetical protein
MGEVTKQSSWTLNKPGSFRMFLCSTANQWEVIQHFVIVRLKVTLPSGRSAWKVKKSQCLIEVISQGFTNDKLWHLFVRWKYLYRGTRVSAAGFHNWKGFNKVEGQTTCRLNFKQENPRCVSRDTFFHLDQYEKPSLQGSRFAWGPGVVSPPMSNEDWNVPNNIQVEMEKKAPHAVHKGLNSHFGTASQHSSSFLHCPAGLVGASRKENSSASFSYDASSLPVFV